jgi:putative spermidine/putrescine transport system ATP-binding protein
LKQLQRELGITFLFVTHDQSEALAISDRVVLLSRGRIEQCGSPREIYSRPRTAYAASFLGKSNLIRGTVRQGVVDCGVFSFALAAPDGPVTLSLRPEAIGLAAAFSGPDVVRFEAKVAGEQFHGANSLLTLRCSGDVELTARVGAHDAGGVELFAFRAADCVVLEANSEGRT